MGTAVVLVFWGRGGRSTEYRPTSPIPELSTVVWPLSTLLGYELVAHGCRGHCTTLGLQAPVGLGSEQPPGNCVSQINKKTVFCKQFHKSLALTQLFRPGHLSKRTGRHCSTSARRFSAALLTATSREDTDGHPLKKGPPKRGKRGPGTQRALPREEHSLAVCDKEARRKIPWSGNVQSRQTQRPRVDGGERGGGWRAPACWGRGLSLGRCSSPGSTEAVSAQRCGMCL